MSPLTTVFCWAKAFAGDPVRSYNYVTMRYGNPPLVEAVFEVFAVQTAWSDDASAALEGAFRESYSGKRDTLRPVGVHLRMGPGLELQSAKQEHPERVRLWTAVGDRMVQFAPNMCALNVMPPYSHYEDYRPEFERLVGMYLEQAKPRHTFLLGHRYINKVVLPPAGAPDEYFEVYPALPQRIREQHPPFSMQVEVATLDIGGNVVLTLTAKGVEEDRLVYVLDLYARQESPGKPVWSDIALWHDAAHKTVMEAFEMSITDKARALFELEAD